MSGNSMPSSFDDNPDFHNESRWSKLLTKLKNEPLIPLGCALTVAALFGANKAMRVNDHARANIMFRRRIYAQAFTLAALVAGSAYWSGDRDKRRELEVLEMEKSKAQKRERWLAELEARDREDKDIKEKMARRMGRRRGDVIEDEAAPSGPVRAELAKLVDGGTGREDK